MPQLARHTQHLLSTTYAIPRLDLEGCQGFRRSVRLEDQGLLVNRSKAAAVTLGLPDLDGHPPLRFFPSLGAPLLFIKRFTNEIAGSLVPAAVTLISNAKR